MSAKQATVSKPQSRLEKAVVNSPRAAKARAIASPVVAAIAPSATPERTSSIVASAIELIRFRELKRAPENVRHIRKDEDIEPLADDIGAHGLLQSLIGYRAIDEDHKTPVERVWIVGGGRRLQALGILIDRGVIDLDFGVPILIRDRAEAVELSLTENLQKRDMSPVDECHAFVALMAPGNTSPLELAKRFGFSEIYVKQRLRLAELAEPIITALAEKKITIGSAMAYAASSDRDLQLQIFKQQEKATFDKHAPVRVKADYSASQLTTGSPLFQFVGAEIYERDGGTYEDDLFGANESAARVGRKLASGPILNAAARQMIEFQGLRLQLEMQRDGHPSIDGCVIAPNFRTDTYPWKAPAAPSGYAFVEAGYGSNSAEKIWERIDDQNIAVQIIIGVNSRGEIAAVTDKFFVPRDKIDVVKLKSSSNSAYSTPSPEEVAKRTRDRIIQENAWRLGVPSTKETPFEGRSFWPPSYNVSPIEVSRDPSKQNGRLVAIQIFVSEEDYRANLAEAEKMADEQIARREAEAVAHTRAIAEHPERVAEILAMLPPPNVVVVDGDAYCRDGFGNYLNAVGDDDLDDIHGAEDQLSLASLLDGATPGDLIEPYATVELFNARKTAPAGDL